MALLSTEALSAFIFIFSSNVAVTSLTSGFGGEKGDATGH
jgi:hypothetical protein